MARRCTVCHHPERVAIDKAVVAGESAGQIAAKFRVSEDAVTRHRLTHLPATLLKAQEAQDAEQAIDVMAELRRCFLRVNKLFDACDRWLADPDDPTRYTLDPRAEDISVIYNETGVDGNPHRAKARLSDLLARAGVGIDVERWESKYADPRELILKAASQLQSQTELLAKLLGELDERPTVNVTLSPEWLAVRAALVQTLAPFPDARAAVASALLKLEAAGNGLSRN